MLFRDFTTNMKKRQPGAPSRGRDKWQMPRSMFFFTRRQKYGIAFEMAGATGRPGPGSNAHNFDDSYKYLAAQAPSGSDQGQGFSNMF